MTDHSSGIVKLIMWGAVVVALLILALVGWGIYELYNVWTGPQ